MAANTSDINARPIWAHPVSLSLFVLTIVIIKLLVSASTQLIRDEGYYALWSFYPSIGYFDHSPMVAWMIFAGRALLGDTEAGVRLPAVLSGLLIAAAQWRVASLLFNAQAGACAIYWYALGVTATLLLLVMTPDVPSTLFWTLSIWALAELQVSGKANWWLAVGLFAGLGLLSKYTNVFLGAGLLLWLVGSRSRWHWLKTWQFWTSGVLALALFSPVVFYNAAHNWEGFLFQGARGSGALGTSAGTAANLLEFWLSPLLLYLPVTALLAYAAIFAAFAKSTFRDGLQLVVLTCLPLLAYFLVYAFGAKVEANWTMPVWPMLVLGAAGFASGLRWQRPWLRIAFGTALFSNFLIGAALAALIYAQAVFHPFSMPAIDRTQEMHGWRELAAHVVSTAEETGASWIATDADYSLTGLLAFYVRAEGSTLEVRDISESHRYRFLPPLLNDPAKGAAVLVQEGKKRDTGERFSTLTPMPPFVRQIGNDRLGVYQLFSAKDPITPVLR